MNTTDREYKHRTCADVACTLIKMAMPVPRYTHARAWALVKILATLVPDEFENEPAAVLWVIQVHTEGRKRIEVTTMSDVERRFIDGGPYSDVELWQSVLLVLAKEMDFENLRDAWVAFLSTLVPVDDLAAAAAQSDMLTELTALREVHKQTVMKKKLRRLETRAKQLVLK